MRLYLSSFRLGNHIDELIRLVGDGRRVALIENAIDHVPEGDWQQYRESTYDISDVFSQLGFEVTNLDLREYFGQSDALERAIDQFDLVWACGGNVFLLRRAMRQSCLDKILKRKLESDAFVYGGFSAGICVLTPSLKGLELCDPPSELATGYDSDIIWDGLGIVDYSIAPHYKSDHPEASMIDEVVSYFGSNGVAYKAIRDGDVILINDEKEIILKLEDGQPNELNLDLSDRHLAIK